MMALVTRFSRPRRCSARRVRGEVGRCFALFDANGGAVWRQEIARRLLCNRQRVSVRQAAGLGKARYWRATREPWKRGVTVQLPTDADMRQGTEESKDVQQPQYNDNDDDGVEDGFDRTLYGDIAIDQPEQNANNDQNQHYLN